MRERNSSSGIMGERLLRSVSAKARSSSAPRGSAAITCASDQPRAEEAISPYTTLPSPVNASSAPRQSMAVPASGSRLSGT